MLMRGLVFLFLFITAFNSFADDAFKSGVEALQSGDQDALLKHLKPAREKSEKKYIKYNNSSTKLKTALKKYREFYYKNALSGKIPVNKRSKSGSTPIMHAAAYGDRKAVKKLISMGADVNSRKNNGGTSLIIASEFGHDAIARDLLTMGAAPELTALHNEINPLVQAASFNHINVLTTLLSYGADPNPDLSRGSPLCSAAKTGNFKATKVLIEHGADIEKVCLISRTPLNYALGFIGANHSNYHKTAELLLIAGANPYAKTGLGFNSFDLATSKGNKKGLELLEKHKSRYAKYTKDKQERLTSLVKNKQYKGNSKISECATFILKKKLCDQLGGIPGMLCMKLIPGGHNCF